jgi:hypothetical protein
MHVGASAGANAGPKNASADRTEYDEVAQKEDLQQKEIPSLRDRLRILGIVWFPFGVYSRLIRKRSSR